VNQQLIEAEESGRVNVPVETLRTFLDRDLLPMSHRLADTVTPWGRELAVAPRPAEVPDEVLPRTLNCREVFRPALLTYVVFFLALGSAGTRLPVIAAGMVAIIMAIFVGSMTLGIRALLGRVEMRTLMALIASSFLVGLVFAAAVQFMLILAVAQESRSVLFAGFAGVLFGLLSGLAAMVDAGFTRSREALRAQIHDLQDATSLLRQELWLSRRRFGYALHGGLQAAIHAATIRLATMGAHDPQVVAMVRDEIRQAFDRVVIESSVPPTLDDVCGEISATWQHACEVTWQIGAGVAEALQAHPVAAECSSEVLLETVQNAIRHGRASTVHVDATLDGDRIVLSIVDNGTPSEQMGNQGLGSRMLDEFCSQWSRNPLHFGTHVRAELVLA
jgi:signal transduction histidine kinase